MMAHSAFVAAKGMLCVGVAMRPAAYLLIQKAPHLPAAARMLEFPQRVDLLSSVVSGNLRCLRLDLDLMMKSLAR